MKFHLIIWFFFFSKNLKMIASSKAENNFVYVRSGVTQSNACILNEFAIDNSTISARLQCGIPCNSLSQCVGVDIVEGEAKRCRLLYGFPALIPYLTASDDTVRYQKLIQRRFDGSENFWRNWVDYENGFGSRDSEFWLGNLNIHELTNDGYTYLRIEMMDQDCIWKYAEFSTFYVESDSFKYRLHVDGYSGNAGDSLQYHSGMFFTTYDSDNDNSGSNCGSIRRGGWWYNACHWSNLNGEYGNTNHGEGINWHSWKGVFYSMKDVIMMVRKP